MGEINNSDSFGSTIIKVVKKFNLQTILELGSWDGTGSTQCFIEALKDQPNPKLYCIELRKDRFDQLVENTKQYNWIECTNKSTISYKNLLHKDFDKIWISPYNKIAGSDYETVQSWFNEDIEITKTLNKGYLDDDTKMYDGVLIDSGEFFGYSEFILVKDRTKFLFLDDCYKAYKNRQVMEELQESEDWEMIAADSTLRNGWSIFKRK